MTDSSSTNTDTTNTDATATTDTTTQTRTATNSFRFSGESSGYQAYKPNEWTSPKEILFSSFTITETDLRVKTAEFSSPHYIDMTKGRVCVWIQRKYGDNFGGIVLKAERDSENGMYKYVCQDWNRLLTNRVYVVLNGEWNVYKVIMNLLSKCGLSTDGLGKIESYDGMIDEVPQDDDPTETNSKSTTTTTTTTSTDTSSSSGKEGESTKTTTTTNKDTEKETKLQKGNSFRQKPTGLYDKITARELILALVMKEGVNIDIYMDENGVLHFQRYEKDTWMKERWYFVDHEIYDAHLTFDITDLITQVAVKHVDALDGNATLYTSEKQLGVKIAAFFGVMGTVIDNPVKSSGGNTTAVASGDGVTFTGKPSAGKCCARNNGGVMPPYKSVTRSYKNYCPMCKATNCLADTPKNPSRSRVAEGEISCTKCGADYCICCGAEKDGSCRSNLIKAGGGTTVSSTSSSSSSSSSASTGGSISNTNGTTDTTSTDASLTEGSAAAVEDYAKNKIAARIAFSESIRKWYTFTIKLPGEYRHLHTNSFCMFMMSETFMLENLPVIGKKLNGKFTRYAGYEKNRYYIEKVVTTCDENVGLQTELTLNPFATDYSTFTKTQVQAEEALQSALGGGGSGGAISGDLVGIGKALASKYHFCSGAAQTYAGMKKNGCGSCFSWSEALFTELKKAGYKVRVIQYATSSAPNHRSVQYMNNGQWVDYPYREAGIDTGARATRNKPGMFVFKDWNDNY